MDAFVRASTIAPEDAETYFGVGCVYKLKQQCDPGHATIQKSRSNCVRLFTKAQRELAYCYHNYGLHRSGDQTV